MKKSSLLYLLPLTLFACNSATKKSETTDSSVTTTKTITDSVTVTTSKTCYQLVSGNTKRDTANISLTVTGNEVGGTYNNMIWEKDSRKGTLVGTKQNDEIIGSWKFMQEGMTDSLPVAFKIQGDKLLAKDYSFDSKTGRQFISDTAAYSRTFSTVDCKE
ncbi:hypothetical protein GS399_11515 [Pedobacter sp. HMF7647]|uniref:Copper resistance protein NlpE n=1 Tax=Hufsiella arboris TaxID=2695275 RepID=A0A7K1YAY9_9SPHI|nr:hypothetical protein [Hufsiella arboris]MXV51600.1 hypothetical protein [Hufsiella arboris]